MNETENQINNSEFYDPANDTTGMEEFRALMKQAYEGHAGEAEEEEPAEEPVQNEEVAEESVDEEQEEHADELDEETQQEETTEGKPAKKNKKQWYNNKQLHKLKGENQLLVNKIRELEGTVDKFYQANTYQYHQNVLNEMEQAKLLRKEAAEKGQWKEYEEAEKVIMKNMIILNDLEKNAREYERYAAHAQNDQNSPAQHEPADGDEGDNYYVESLRDWVSDYPELDDTSPKYNKSLAELVGTRLKREYRNLARMNKVEDFCSPQFFDRMDDYVNSVRQKRVGLTTPVTAKPVTMAPVRSASRTSGTAAQERNFSSLEKDFMRGFHMSEKDMLEQDRLYEAHLKNKGGY